MWTNRQVMLVPSSASISASIDPAATITLYILQLTTGLQFRLRSKGECAMKRLTSLILFFCAPCAIAQATFHGNNARTGVYDSSGPKQFKEVKWAFKTYGPVIASPAIADGVVFIGSSDGAFYAIDQETGKRKWRVVLTDPISSSPAVADGLVYFLTYDGAFYALTADTGALKWRFATGGERRFEAKGIHGLTPSNQNIADPMDLYLSSPAVFDGRVYFGSSDGHVYALDAKTGILQWSFETQDIVHASPAIANNTVYIGSWDSYLYALDAATAWKNGASRPGKIPSSTTRLDSNLLPPFLMVLCM
jgi:outer membrane protein assembly factor BamB